MFESPACWSWLFVKMSHNKYKLYSLVYCVKCCATNEYGQMLCSLSIVNTNLRAEYCPVPQSLPNSWRVLVIIFAAPNWVLMAKNSNMHVWNGKPQFNRTNWICTKEFLLALSRITWSAFQLTEHKRKNCCNFLFIFHYFILKFFKCEQFKLWFVPKWKI